MTHNCVGLFCEDIREEVSGSHSIIGVMPDNVNFAGPAPPGIDAALMIPKMGFYLRVNLDRAVRPDGPVSAKVTFPGVDEIKLGEIGIEAITQAFADAAEKGQPIVGLIFKGVVAPLQFRKSGIATIYAIIDGKEIEAAILNVVFSEQP